MLFENNDWDTPKLMSRDSIWDADKHKLANRKGFDIAIGKSTNAKAQIYPRWHFTLEQIQHKYFSDCGPRIP